MTAEQLGTRLRQVREVRGWSLRETADKAEISATYLQKLERGQVKSPSPNVLYALSKPLNVPYSDLMRLAGYVVPRGSDERIPMGTNVLAHALSSEDLSEKEAEELAKYLSWFRSQQSSNT
jgi:transcriptional regulator with XRE-family HTH domain